MSQQPADPHESFCFNYLQKKKTPDNRNLTHNSRTKSEKSLRYEDNFQGEDMFTSIRNVINNNIYL